MSIGRKIKELLTSVAPTLGLALGGPMGGVAMKFLADKFTDGDTGTVEDFLLSANPETLKQLKIAEMEFSRSMKQLDIDLEEVAFKDRSSARALAVKTGIEPQVILSGVYIVGYFGLLYAFVQGHVEVQEQFTSLFNGLLGVLSAAQIQIINFWFGSSAGSKAKTDALSSVIK